MQKEGCRLCGGHQRNIHSPSSDREERTCTRGMSVCQLAMSLAAVGAGASARISTRARSRAPTSAWNTLGTAPGSKTISSAAVASRCTKQSEHVAQGAWKRGSERLTARSEPACRCHRDGACSAVEAAFAS